MGMEVMVSMRSESRTRFDVTRKTCKNISQISAPGKGPSRRRTSETQGTLRCPDPWRSYREHPFLVLRMSTLVVITPIGKGAIADVEAQTYSSYPPNISIYTHSYTKLRTESLRLLSLVVGVLPFFGDIFIEIRRMSSLERHPR